MDLQPVFTIFLYRFPKVKLLKCNILNFKTFTNKIKISILSISSKKHKDKGDAYEKDIINIAFDYSYSI